MLEQEQGLAGVLREGDGGEVEQPAHGEGLECEADAEHVGEDRLERPRPAPAPLEEDERRVVQPQRDGRVPGARRRGGSSHRGDRVCCREEGVRVSPPAVLTSRFPCRRG